MDVPKPENRLRVSRLSRMLISQTSDVWEFHVSWCRFVSPGNDHNSTRPHRHSLYEMHYVTGGSLSIWLPDGKGGEREHIISADSWIILPPGVQHRLAFHSPDSKKLVIGFSLKNPSPLIRMNLNEKTSAVILPGNDGMRSLIAALAEKGSESLPMTAYIISGLIQCLILEAINRTATVRPEDVHLLQNRQKNSLTDERVDAADRYIRSRVTLTLTAQEVADHVGLNIRHLNRLFTQVYGYTVFEHIRRIRVSYAQNLLETTSMTLNDIAEVMDFSSVYAFIRFFRDACGVPPGRFRSDTAAR